MRLILSRKGFDSSAGGAASPILEDGRMVSLPIPESRGSVAYGELAPRGIPLAQLVADLTDGRLGPRSRAHLDPDLDRSALPRHRGWLPSFGQSDYAARHLDLQSVGPGDLFLFFGWFQPVTRVAGRWRYRIDSPGIHAIFGWLRVSRVLDPVIDRPPPWLARHPHYDRRIRRYSRVYLGKDAGVFPRFHTALQLTAPGANRSLWRLPFRLVPGHPISLSYHRNPARWRAREDDCLLQTVGRGQEFVVSCSAGDPMYEWAQGFVAHAA